MIVATTVHSITVAINNRLFHDQGRIGFGHGADQPKTIHSLRTFTLEKPFSRPSYSMTREQPSCQCVPFRDIRPHDEEVIRTPDCGRGGQL